MLNKNLQREQSAQNREIIHKANSFVAAFTFGIRLSTPPVLVIRGRFLPAFGLPLAVFGRRMMSAASKKAA
ncbi:hypothetical protein [Microbacterium lacticum]